MTEKLAKQIVFGLDIGTRSVVGTVGYLEDETFHIIAQRIIEHETRAMLDGQIHDIGRVGATIKEVKEALEDDLDGRKLKEVCIAAAGRVLRTVNVTVSMDLEEEQSVSQELIYSLDLLGVENAYEKFQESNDTDMKFYCVGYTVVKYYLNDYPITNLENHKAKKIGAELIATFLPDDVVDGLYKAVQSASLSVANLTLEPIAAITVAIPQMYRMLNIALVDVGAGTSDICITKDGAIIAYGMIPQAGDELTEAIAKACLTDFATAEKIKVSATRKGPIKYKDIMGLEQKIEPSGVLKIVDGVVASMAKNVADKMKELNGDKSVSAVFVVGGGGKIPGFTTKLAKELGIAPERVALRGEEVMNNIVFDSGITRKDSLFVTPIGICLNFYDQKNNFIFVNFNRERIKLYDNSHLAVVDAAMQAGFPNDAFFPRRGRELHYTINGKSKVMRGESGESASITVNGNPADVNTKIQAGDKIIVKESTVGADAYLEIRNLPEYDSTIEILVNDKKVVLPKFAEVNGNLQSEFYEIKENDQIKMLNYYTVEQIVEFMDLTLLDDINVYVNNKKAEKSERVYENFSVLFTKEDIKSSAQDETTIVPSADMAEEEDDDEEIIIKRPEESKANFTHEKSSNDLLKEAAIEAGIYTNEELEESKKQAEERFMMASNIAKNLVEEDNTNA